jgi:hypothetical protein
MRKADYECQSDVECNLQESITQTCFVLQLVRDGEIYKRVDTVLWAEYSWPVPWLDQCTTAISNLSSTKIA